ncbi:MAG: hypothetical protein IJI41_10815 [Anaerolineaceae bacterium]|nr:hypothetical protein [Anaerolineaceae bacterium]
MNRIMNIIEAILDYVEGPDGVTIVLDSLSKLDIDVNWIRIIKVCFILVLSMVIAIALFLLNDSLFGYIMKRRTKRHKLTITNNGNTSSVFLLRAVDIPSNLAFRFSANGNPMLKVTYSAKKDIQPEDSSVDYEKTAPALPDAEDSEQSHVLIPDLNDPMGKTKKDANVAKEAVGTVTKTINNIGRKAGFFASIASNITTLLPVKLPGLQAAQNSLKDFQQEATQTTAAITTKTNTVESLGNQLGQLPMADKLSGAAKSMGQEAAQAAGQMANNAYSVNTAGTTSGFAGAETLTSKNFIYDENVWLHNADNDEKESGLINYYQSKVLEPSESMKVDIEIANFSENTSAVSHLYKIEILQFPQSNLHLTAPSHYVNGIVIFKKVTRFDRIFPFVLVTGLVILSVQLISLLSKIVF